MLPPQPCFHRNNSRQWLLTILLYPWKLTDLHQEPSSLSRHPTRRNLSTLQEPPQLAKCRRILETNREFLLEIADARRVVTNNRAQEQQVLPALHMSLQVDTLHQRVRFRPPRILWLRRHHLMYSLSSLLLLSRRTLHNRLNRHNGGRLIYFIEIL